MPNNDATDRPAEPGAVPHLADSASGSAEAVFLQLHAEQVSVSKRRVLDQVVRVATKTQTRDVVVEEPLSHEAVVVERVPVGRYVDAIPDIRQDGDVTVMPVVEEEIVVTRRLFLREEVHIRKVRSSTTHVETVTLREQKVVVTRESSQPIGTAQLATVDAGGPASTNPNRSTSMESETIVAVYDTAAHAELAANDLRQAGVPDSAISLNASTETTTTTTGAPVRETGFWSSLFGGDAASDTTVYDRSMASGSTVVTVKTPETHITRVMEILESHHPVDIDDRASSYGMTSAATDMAASSAGMATGSYADTTTTATATGSTVGLATQPGTIQLAEESLAVGKRLINRGGTRIRRYVVETPVEESVSLRSETVTLERHPVTDGRTVADADFSEKTIEMTETAEEAVVAKTARVVEEVGLRKEATDRVETIRDTVRKDEVTIEQIPGTVTTETTTTGPVTTPKI